MKKIVVKVGTSALTQGTQTLSRRFMLGLAQQLAHLQSRGIEVVLVSSGAVATGRDLLNSPQFSPSKQTFASIGQVKLIQIWSELFSFFDLQVGQVLLAKDDFSLQKKNSTRDTLNCLLQNKILPIINENDAIATSETRIGDNDNLAALVADAIGADRVILLTDQEGLFTADPRIDSEAKLIGVVEQIDEAILSLAKGSSTILGTGGMAAKIEAARRASKSGIRTVIASASRPNVLIDLAEGKRIGTIFLEERGLDASQIKKMAVEAREAKFVLAKVSSAAKNKALEILIENLKSCREAVLEANRLDIDLAMAKGLSAPLLERLSIENRMEGIIHDIEQVIALPDPVGETFDQMILPNGLKLSKCRTPIGVLGAIYESRPNVTLDIAALAIKSGNCAILRGGSESLQTNRVLVELIQTSLISAGLPADAIQLIAHPSRENIKELLQLHEYVDLIIPRGSLALQEFCLEHSKIPVVTGGIGICHLFVDETADLERSLQVILNAKTQRPTVCNALDTLLVHSAMAHCFIPKIVNALSQKGVSFRLDEKSGEFAKEPSCSLAGAADWDTEWLSLVLGVKTVENLSEAIAHIQAHSTGHSDGILTENGKHAERFLREIDSAAVYVNASTRFTDGGQFGLGAEAAISTQKLHARGPMGLKELTSYKWIIQGNYHVRG